MGLGWVLTSGWSSAILVMRWAVIPSGAECHRLRVYPYAYGTSITYRRKETKMTEGEILGFGGFIVTNLVGISWFARGLQKDSEETRNEIRELKKEFKEHKENGSDLSKELKLRVENLEEWKKSSDSMMDRLRARTHDIINIIMAICIKLDIPFNRRENW